MCQEARFPYPPCWTCCLTVGKSLGHFVTQFAIHKDGLIFPPTPQESYDAYFACVHRVLKYLT